MNNYVIKSGWGFNVGEDFARAKSDIPITLSPAEYARPNCVIGYIQADPSSSLGFLRHGGQKGVRVHVQKSALKEV